MRRLLAAAVVMGVLSFLSSFLPDARAEAPGVLSTRPAAPAGTVWIFDGRQETYYAFRSLGGPEDGVQVLDPKDDTTWGPAIG